MYYFIFEQVTDKRLQTTARQIEDAVVNQGIAGELTELTPTKSIDTLISDANQKGYQTLVIVGDNKLVNLAAAKLLRYDMVLGIVPLTESPSLLEIIGVSNWSEAVIALKQRRWRYAPLGHINNTNIFLTKVKLHLTSPTSLTISEQNYSAELHINSAQISTRAKNDKQSLVCLECQTVTRNNWEYFWNRLTRKNDQQRLSKFCSTSFSLQNNDHIPIEIDNNVIGRVPATFRIIPKALRLIVAKQRAN